MITKQRYVEYLICTPSNYTCFNLAEHLDIREGSESPNTVDLSRTKPSPEGEGWVTTARMQEVEQRREQLPRGN